jgi:uncharacterized protein with beta-barrel porin domain
LPLLGDAICGGRRHVAKWLVTKTGAAAMVLGLRGVLTLRTATAVASSRGAIRARFLGGASSIALPAAALVLGVSLADGASAQTTISGVHTSTIDLANYVSGNPFTFLPGANVTTTAGDAVYGNNTVQWTVTNNGTLTGNQSGINLQTLSTVTNAGTITGGLDFGVYLHAGGSVTNQAGGVISGGANGVYLGNGGSVTNQSSGTISGGNNGVIVRSSAGTVTNAGSIAGGNGFGVYLRAGGSVTNQAGGVINGGGAGVVVNAGGTVTNAGTISGAVSVQFEGSGTNVLTLQTGSVLNGTAVGSAMGTTNALVLQGTGTANNNFIHFTTLDMQASGVWTLGGNSTFGSGLVESGTLAVTGTLHVTNNLTFNPGSGLGITISPSGASTVTVGGTATLTGASLQVSASSLITHTETFTILSANAISGTFSSAAIVGTAFARNPRLIVDGSNVDLTVDSASFAAVLPASASINQVNVAKAIDNALTGSAALPAGFQALGNLAATNLPGALTQLSGETATGSQQTTFDAMTQFLGVMTDPFGAGRGEAASGGAGVTPFAEETASVSAANGKSKTDDAYAMFTKAPPAAFEARWSTWAAGFAGSQTTDGNAATGSNSTTSRIFGTAAGADYRFSPFTIAGFALAGGGTNFSVANSGTGRSDLFQAGAFVRHNVGQAYISGALAYGWQDITTDRTVSVAGIDRLHAEFNANAFSGRVEGGYRFVSPWTGGVGLTPYAAGQFTTFDLPGYAESVLAGGSSFALAYNSKSVTDSRSEVGLRTDKSYAVQDGILTLRGRVAWAHDYDPDRTIAATFQALPGASFVVGGAAQAADSALTTASVEMKWRNGWSAAATFEGEFSNVTSSYAGKGVVRYNW